MPYVASLGRLLGSRKPLYSSVGVNNTYGAGPAEEGSDLNRRLMYHMQFDGIYELVIFILGAIFGGLFL